LNDTLRLTEALGKGDCLMKLKVVLEAQIEDDPQKIIQELRKLIADNESLVELKITGGQVQWEKNELTTS